MPKLAIVTPVYADEQNQRLGFLEQTLRSTAVLSDDFVHLIVDDGSPVDVADAIMPFLSDSRFRYVRRKRKPTDRKTASNALNLGFNMILDGSGRQLSESECADIGFITALHSDDLMVDLKHRHDLLASDVFCAAMGDMYMFTNSSLKLRKRNELDIPTVLSTGKQGPVNYHTLMWKKSTLSAMRNYNVQKLGIYGTYLPHIAFSEDDAISKLTMVVANMNKHRVGYTRVPAMFYRCHQKSITHTIPQNDKFEDRLIVRDMYFRTKPFFFETSLYKFLYSQTLLRNVVRTVRHMLRPKVDMTVMHEFEKKLSAYKV